MFNKGIILIFALIFEKCSAYIVTVERSNEECFFEKVQNGTKLELYIEVLNGDYGDIIIRINGQGRDELQPGHKASSPMYAFVAEGNGNYTFCIYNRAKLDSRMVMFSLETISSTRIQNATIEVNPERAKLRDTIQELGEALRKTKRRQEYLNVRAWYHKEINDKTNTQVVWWSAFEALVLLVMSFGQIYYIKKFFEVRRVV